jgi:hypothetical protein
MTMPFFVRIGCELACGNPASAIAMASVARTKDFFMKNTPEARV